MVASSMHACIGLDQRRARHRVTGSGEPSFHPRASPASQVAPCAMPTSKQCWRRAAPPGACIQIQITRGIHIRITKGAGRQGDEAVAGCPGGVELPDQQVSHQSCEPNTRTWHLLGSEVVNPCTSLQIPEEHGTASFAGAWKGHNL